MELLTINDYPDIGEYLYSADGTKFKILDNNIKYRLKSQNGPITEIYKYQLIILNVKWNKTKHIRKIRNEKIDKLLCE